MFSLLQFALQYGHAVFSSLLLDFFLNSAMSPVVVHVTSCGYHSYSMQWYSHALLVMLYDDPAVGKAPLYNIHVFYKTILCMCADCLSWRIKANLFTLNNFLEFDSTVNGVGEYILFRPAA